MGRIVITGGAGAIATRVRPLLRRVGQERVLVDLVDPADADAGETVVVADITDEKVMGPERLRDLTVWSIWAVSPRSGPGRTSRG